MKKLRIQGLLNDSATRWIGLTLFLFLCQPNSLFAHGGHGNVQTLGGFPSGFVHPISGLDHVLAMIAVGIWGAQLGHPQVWLLPLVFPMVMACGASLGLIGMPLPGVELGIASSAIVLGWMVMLAARPPLVISLVLVGVFALFHGHAHGTELPEGASGVSYSMGFVIGTGMLHAVGIGIGTIKRWSKGDGFLRASGALVLIGGIYFFASSLL